MNEVKKNVDEFSEPAERGQVRSLKSLMQT